MQCYGSSTSKEFCSICQDDLYSQARIKKNQIIENQIMDCSHIFHEACIGEWFKINQQDQIRTCCPLCKVKTYKPEMTIGEKLPEEPLRFQIFSSHEEASDVLYSVRANPDTVGPNPVLLADLRELAAQIRNVFTETFGLTMEQVTQANLQFIETVRNTLG